MKHIIFSSILFIGIFIIISLFAFPAFWFAAYIKSLDIEYPFFWTILGISPWVGAWIGLAEYLSEKIRED